MIKKTGYLIFSVFVLITQIKYLNSMEKEREKRENDAIIKVLQMVCPILADEIAEMIVAYRGSMEESKKQKDQKKTGQHLQSEYCYTPSEGGSSFLFDEGNSSSTEYGTKDYHRLLPHSGS